MPVSCSFSAAVIASLTQLSCRLAVVNDYSTDTHHQYTLAQAHGHWIYIWAFPDTGGGTIASPYRCTNTSPTPHHRVLSTWYPFRRQPMGWLARPSTWDELSGVGKCWVWFVGEPFGWQSCLLWTFRYRRSSTCPERDGICLSLPMLE